MTRLRNIQAIPHPEGNRIDLAWQHPADAPHPGVRVVRREQTHPSAPNDGVLVAEGVGLTRAVDRDLRGETTYYYTLFPYAGSPPVYHFDPLNRAVAMATAPYDYAGRLYDLLPGIYHRYDESDAGRGQLRRFLELPGGQLDQIHSLARALLDLHDPDRVDGRLLPLLAAWIGWQTDYRLDLASQRNELRHAPYLYRAIGLVPALEATVKRVIGWESRTKEFVHNVLRSNSPERLNLWLSRRDSHGAWSRPTQPLSLNDAYDGRPSAARDAEGRLWLFYHTRKKERWAIWCKQRGADGAWSPSRPLVGAGQPGRYPAAALQGDTLWLFWSDYDAGEGRWRLFYRTRRDQRWSPPQRFAAADDCRQPWAAVDARGGLWLFWIAHAEGRWQLRYCRHDGTAWAPATPATLPLDAGQEPRVERDLLVLCRPTDGARPLGVFWARQDPDGPAADRRWQIAYRFKAGLDPNITADWGAVGVLPQAPGHEDREPAALIDPAGAIELFWSSTRDGSWSIWRTTLDPATGRWGALAPITEPPASQRAPLPIADPAGAQLIYRASDSLTYTSGLYTATETSDSRYAGCLTVDTRNRARIALRNQFADVQTYTAVVKPRDQAGDADWYARDTVGLYLTPTTRDTQRIERTRSLIRTVLPRFLPLQVRAALFIEPVEIDQEPIYTYSFPDAAPQRLIDERVLTQITERDRVERYDAPADRASARVPGWRRMRAWGAGAPQTRTVDLSVTPVETSHRIWQAGVEDGG